MVSCGVAGMIWCGMAHSDAVHHCDTVWHGDAVLGMVQHFDAENDAVNSVVLVSCSAALFRYLCCGIFGVDMVESHSCDVT